MRFARIVFASAVIALGAVSAHAQGAPDFSKVEIKANKVTDKFYTLDGQGGTIGVLSVSYTHLTLPTIYSV